MKKRTVLVGMLAALTMFAAGCGGKDAAKESKVLRAGTEPTFAPFEFQEKDSKDFTGFDMDLIRAIGKEMGYDVEIQNLGFDGLIPALQGKNIDAIISGMSINDERKQNVLFSDPYYQSGLTMVVRDNETAIKSFQDLKGKKVAVTWAYSPSYGKPLSCPQSLISLLPRFGMDVTLAHPEGYDLMPEVVERAKGYAAESGTTFKQVNTMAEAFEGADIVIPKSWAPFAAMEKRTNLYAEGDDAGIAALEKELLAQNATHQDWCSTTELMEKTANGQDTIFMHPLPADISGVSCEHGEVNADVFDMHRVGMYKEASYKPYAIAAMMFLQKVADPAATLKALDERNTARWLQA